MPNNNDGAHLSDRGLVMGVNMLLNEYAPQVGKGELGKGRLFKYLWYQSSRHPLLSLAEGHLV